VLADHTKSLDRGIRGWDAVLLCQTYRDYGDENALALLLEYNKEDVINLKGLFFLSRAVARIMKEQGGGTIINVASMDGFTLILDWESERSWF